MDFLTFLMDTWWLLGIAAVAFIWYGISTASARTKRCADEWEAMNISRESEDEPVPEVPKHRSWDLHIYLYAGLLLCLLAFIGGVTKLIEFVITLILALD
ncbi:MAG: hypothetical protein U9Q03_05595 [Patescibacteria group bacterium]|nr:hypothetical protein [Patescibacteria group bacterium]